MSEEKNGLLKQQAARFLAWMVGIVGTALVVPQDLIVKEGLPALKDAVATFYNKGKPEVREKWLKGKDWVGEYWRAFKLTTLFCMIFSVCVMALGIVLHDQVHATIGHAVAVLGALILQVFFAGIMFRAVFLLTILTYKFRLVRRIVLGKETAEEKEKEKEARKKRFEQYRGYVVVTLTVFSIALLPFQFFPSWDVLALSVKLTGLAIPAVLITIYLKKDAGWVFNAILNVLIGVLILMFVGFVCTEMFPRSFGKWSVSGLDGWFSGITPSEWVVSFIALGLIALLLRGVFTKDAHTRAATFLALMWLVPLSVGFSIFLVWSMRISYREITNHEPPNVSGEIDDVKDAIKSTFGSKKSAYHPGPAPVAGTGGPVFMSPPTRSRGAETAPQTGPIKASSGGRPAPKKRLPPPPEEKSFKDDPGAAIEALEAIEE